MPSFANVEVVAYLEELEQVFRFLKEPDELVASSEELDMKERWLSMVAPFPLVEPSPVVAQLPLVATFPLVVPFLLVAPLPLVAPFPSVASFPLAVQSQKCHPVVAA